MLGSVGLELAREHKPDLLLLDLHLPDVRGDEVIRRLRGDPQTRRIPIVVVSADATPEQVQRVRRSGADGYLTKPIDVRKFLSLVDSTVPLAAGAGGSREGGR
jgi:CheY-like chemotaxis protein